MSPSSTWVFYALSSCHRTVQATSGWFFSPSYPGTYPENIWCNWTIRADGWQRVEIQIHGFTSQESCEQNADEILIERVPGPAESVLVRACLNSTRHVYGAHALAVYVIFLSRDNPFRSERRFRVAYEVAAGRKAWSGSAGLGAVDLEHKRVRADAAKTNKRLQKARFEALQSNEAKAGNASPIRAVSPTKATASPDTSSHLNLESMPAERAESFKLLLTILQPLQTKSYGSKEMGYSVALSNTPKPLSSGSSVFGRKQVNADLNRVTGASAVKMSDQGSNSIKGDMSNMFTLLEELCSSSELHQYLPFEYHQTPVVYPDGLQPDSPRTTTVIPQKLSVASELLGLQMQDIFRAGEIEEQPRTVLSVSYSVGTFHKAVHHRPVHYSPCSGSVSLSLNVYQGDVNPMLESIPFGSLGKQRLEETTRKALECTGCSLSVTESLARATSKGAGSLTPYSTSGTETHGCIYPSFESIEVVSDGALQQKFNRSTETSSLFDNQWSNGRLEPESSMQLVSYPVDGVAKVPTSSSRCMTCSNAVSRTESWDCGTEQWDAQSYRLTNVNSPSLDPAIKIGEAEGKTVLNLQSSIKPSSVLPSVEWMVSGSSYQDEWVAPEMPDPLKTNPGDYLFEVHIGVEIVGTDLKNSEEIEKNLKYSLPNLVTENLSSFSPVLKGLFLRGIDRAESPHIYFTYWLYFNSTGEPMYIPLKIQMGKLLNKPITDLRSGEALLGSLSIEDVDECLTGIAVCHPNITCLNAFGSYLCHCKKGFEDDSTVSSIKCTVAMKSDFGFGSTLGWREILAGVAILLVLLVPVSVAFLFVMNKRQIAGTSSSDRPLENHRLFQRRPRFPPPQEMQWKGPLILAKHEGNRNSCVLYRISDT